MGKVEPTLECRLQDVGGTWGIHQEKLQALSGSRDAYSASFNKNICMLKFLGLNNGHNLISTTKTAPFSFVMGFLCEVSPYNVIEARHQVLK